MYSAALHIQQPRFLQPGQHATHSFDRQRQVAGGRNCLRESLSQAARDAVIGEIDKNLVGTQRESLQERVLRVL